MNDMMAKIWLAAVLGVLLGVGVAYTTAVPAALQANTKLPVNPSGTQLRTAETTPTFQSNSQLVLISLLAGIVIAAPISIVAKKRT